jgi:DNA-binding MarR family transcriptional regulator
MPELAARRVRGPLLSRSGLARRVARLVDEGLVRRANAAGDGRGVLVAMTDAGVARLAETMPVHLHGVAKLFVERLNDQELAILETALGKVMADCTFG